MNEFISTSQISHARERVTSLRVEFVHADMTKVDYPEAKFDAVVAFYSFFHLPKVDQGPMVKKMVRWLKPGGVLLMNMKIEEGDDIVDRWMGVKMFSAGLGIEGNLKMLREYGEGLEVETEVVGEKLGLSVEVFFQWIWAIKG
jgi:SAM-dependent methyltransferase